MCNAPMGNRPAYCGSMPDSCSICRYAEKSRIARVFDEQGWDEPNVKLMNVLLELEDMKNAMYQAGLNARNE